MNKLKTFDSSYYHGKNYFDESGTQSYYIFQPISKYLKVAYVKKSVYRIYFLYMRKREAKILMTNSNLIDKKGAL